MGGYDKATIQKKGLLVAGPDAARRRYGGAVATGGPGAPHTRPQAAIRAPSSSYAPHTLSRAALARLSHPT